MGPAFGNPQILTLLFDRVVGLVSVRDAYPAEILQEFPGMAGVTCPLAFIQDDLAARIHPPGAVYPL